MEILDGATIETTVARSFSAGNIVVGGPGTQRITIAGASKTGWPVTIESDARFGEGASGSIHLEGDVIEIRDGAQITSRVDSGDAPGDITLLARDWIRIAGADEFSNATQIGGVPRDATQGVGGSVSLQAHVIEIDGGQIATGPPGLSQTGVGGDITLRASERISLRPAILDDAIVLPATVLANSSLNRAAGRIEVHSPILELAGKAAISSATTGSGAGGGVELDVGELWLTGASSIEAESRSAKPDAGDGGGVVVGPSDGSFQTIRLELSDGSRISTDAQRGQGGSIGINAETINLADKSSITASVAGDEPGGNVTFDAAEIALDGSFVAARSTGGGRAGSVRIVAGQLALDASEITTEAGEGGGGDVAIELDGGLRARESEITASVTSGSGGNVSIGPDPRGSRPVFVILEGSDIRASATEAGGFGGRIRITADAFLADTSSTLNASAPGGPEFAGTVELNAPDTDIAGEIATLPESLLDASALLRERCSARAPGDSSGFVVAGRDGVPASPEGLLPAVPLAVSRALEGGDDAWTPPLTFLEPAPLLPFATACD